MKTVGTVSRPKRCALGAERTRVGHGAREEGQGHPEEGPPESGLCFMLSFLLLASPVFCLVYIFIWTFSFILTFSLYFFNFFSAPIWLCFSRLDQAQEPEQGPRAQTGYPCMPMHRLCPGTAPHVFPLRSCPGAVVTHVPQGAWCSPFTRRRSST